MKTFSLPLVQVTQYEGQAQESWAFNTWKVDLLRKHGKGKGIKVAVLDTGIDENHPLFQGLKITAQDFTKSRYGYADKNGHGTHCAGTVCGKDPMIGVANELDELIVGKVLGDSGSGSDSGIAKGIDWAVEAGADILSMSLGSSGPSPTIEKACKRAVEKGKIVFAAAGNEAWNGIGYPGKYKVCLSIAAINRNFEVADFSSRGERIDTSGPGVDILSAAPGGKLALMSGTSMATPFIAGLMAVVLGIRNTLDLPELDYEAMRKQLEFASVDLGKAGKDTNYGPGYVDPLLLALDMTPNPFPVEE